MRGGGHGQYRGGYWTVYGWLVGVGSNPGRGLFALFKTCLWTTLTKLM